MWSGPCTANGATCGVAMNADSNVTISFAKALVAGGFSTRVVRHPARLLARFVLNRAPLAGEATIACAGSKGLRLSSHKLVGGTATCVWKIAARLHGKRVAGVSVDVDDGTSLKRAFALRLPARL